MPQMAEPVLKSRMTVGLRAWGASKQAKVIWKLAWPGQESLDACSGRLDLPRFEMVCCQTNGSAGQES